MVKAPGKHGNTSDGSARLLVRLLMGSLAAVAIGLGVFLPLPGRAVDPTTVRKAQSQLQQATQKRATATPW